MRRESYLKRALKAFEAESPTPDYGRRVGWHVLATFAGLVGLPVLAGGSPADLRVYALSLGCVLFVTWCLLGLRLARKFARRTLAAPSTCVLERSVPWFSLGFVLVLAGLVIVELDDAPFFLQDDNFDQFLPVMIWGAKSALAGAFPAWNPHQFLGAPVASLGIYALTYPITYASYLLATQLGHVEWTLEVFAFVHLLAGYAATFWAARQSRIGPALASAAALSFTLSGYHLIAGRAWYYMLPVAVWAPLLAGFAARLGSRPVGWRWAVGAGVALGAFFHAGNAQMWSYGVLLFLTALGILALGGALPMRRLPWAGLALMIGVGLAAPLLVPQLAFARGVERTLFAGGDIAKGLVAILLPFGLVSAPHPMLGVWGQASVARDHAQLYAAGALLPAIALLGTAVLPVSRVPRRDWAECGWLVCGAFAFLAALGVHGSVWPVLARLPLFQAFQLPYKLLAYFNLYGCLAGACIVERWLSDWRLERWAKAAVFAFCAAATLYGVTRPLPSNYSWPHRAYSPLPPILSASLRSGERVLPLSPRRTTEPAPWLALMQNLPSAYSISSVEGYDTFVEASRENRALRGLLLKYGPAALEAWGIRYALLRRREAGPELSPWVGDWTKVATLLPRVSKVVATFERTTLLELPRAAPLVFIADAERAPLDFAASGKGVSVALPSARAPRQIVFNFVYRPGFVARAPELLPLGVDQWGRMTVELPAGATHVSLEYQPPFDLGLVLMALTLALALAALLTFRRWGLELA